MRKKRTLNINLGQDVVRDQPELVPCSPAICLGFSLLRRERGKPGMRQRAHPPLADRDKGERPVTGRRWTGRGSRAAADEKEREGSKWNHAPVRQADSYTVTVVHGGVKAGEATNARKRRPESTAAARYDFM